MTMMNGCIWYLNVLYTVKELWFGKINCFTSRVILSGVMLVVTTSEWRPGRPL